MIEVNYNDLFHVAESNLLIDLVMNSFSDLKEKDIRELSEPIVIEIIKKIEKLTRGIYE